jgi:hypothetical protein
LFVSFSVPRSLPIPLSQSPWRCIDPTYSSSSSCFLSQQQRSLPLYSAVACYVPAFISGSPQAVQPQQLPLPSPIPPLNLSWRCLFVAASACAVAFVSFPVPRSHSLLWRSPRLLSDGLVKPLLCRFQFFVLAAACALAYSSSSSRVRVLQLLHLPSRNSAAACAPAFLSPIASLPIPLSQCIYLLSGGPSLCRFQFFLCGAPPLSVLMLFILWCAVAAACVLVVAAAGAVAFRWLLFVSFSVPRSLPTPLSQFPWWCTLCVHLLSGGLFKTLLCRFQFFLCGPPPLSVLMLFILCPRVHLLSGGLFKTLLCRFQFFLCGPPPLSVFVLFILWCAVAAACVLVVAAACAVAFRWLLFVSFSVPRSHSLLWCSPRVHLLSGGLFKTLLCRFQFFFCGAFPFPDARPVCNGWHRCIPCTLCRVLFRVFLVSFLLLCRVFRGSFSNFLFMVWRLGCLGVNPY